MGDLTRGSLLPTADRLPAPPCLPSLLAGALRSAGGSDAMGRPARAVR